MLWAISNPESVNTCACLRGGKGRSTSTEEVEDAENHKMKLPFFKDQSQKMHKISTSLEPPEVQGNQVDWTPKSDRPT